MNWNGLELPDKSYYQDDAVVIYHADCRDILPLIPDKSIDLVLTDPPYGIGFEYESGKEDCNKPELYFEYLSPILSQLKRCTIKYIALTQATKYMRFFWDWFGDDIRIYIACKTFVMLRNTFMNYAYDPWVFIPLTDEIRIQAKPARNLDWCISDTASLRNPHNIERNHPTPKPVSMMASLIANFTNPNDIILDPFLGSGTTAYCAKKLGRKCIGIEIEERYCEIASKRCSQSVMALEMK